MIYVNIANPFLILEVQGEDLISTSDDIQLPIVPDEWNAYDMPMSVFNIVNAPKIPVPTIKGIK